MFGLQPIDLAVIALYFGALLYIGWRAAKKIKSQEDYFLGGRGFGKLIQTFAAFGQGTSVENAVGVTTTTFTNGASGMWSSLLTLFATPMYWFTSVWLRRMRSTTAGDFFSDRYGSKRMAAFYALIGMLSMMAVMAVGFSAMGKTVMAITQKKVEQFSVEDRAAYTAAADASISSGKRVLTLPELEERTKLNAINPSERTVEQSARYLQLRPLKPAKTFSHVSFDTLVWVVCFVTLGYTIAGGLAAAFEAELLQGTGIILMSLILLPFAWNKINSMHGGDSWMDALRTLHDQLPASFFQVLGSPAAVNFTWYYIGALSIMVMLSVVIQPNMMVSSGSAKDELSAQIGLVSGNYIKRFCTVLWGVFALSAVVIYGRDLPDSDMVWGYATRDLLGPLGIGLVGFMIACLMSALMSTVSALMITCSGLFTQNIYREFRGNRGEGHYVWVGRISGTLMVLASGWIALQFPTILDLLKFLWELTAMLIPAFWLGMKWHRANRIGAWASMVGGTFAFLVLPILVPTLFPSLRTGPELLAVTQPTPLVVTADATGSDVRFRERQIREWDLLKSVGSAAGERPTPLVEGQPFTTTYQLQSRSVFWTLGTSEDGDNGGVAGRGALSLELVLIHKLGFDLTQNPYALNETIRLVVRTLVPILVMVLVSLLTRPDPRAQLDRFYVKLRTPVNPDRAADAAALAAAQANPASTEGVRLFPGSNWEFYRWKRTDYIGFGFSVAAAFGVILLMHFAVTLGG